MKVIYTTPEFDLWLSNLKDNAGKARILARIERAESGNFGDVEPVGGGVSEMRIHFGPGYRIYFAQRVHEIVILLVGGNKSTQTKDIKAAQKLSQKY